MKTIIVIFLAFGLMIFSGLVQAQVGSSISADGTPPNTNAMLDVKSPSTGAGKGMLIPRVTLAQRTTSSAALAGGLLDNSGNLRGGAAQGLIVYQTDGVQGLYFNTSQTALPAWVHLGEGSDLNMQGHIITNATYYGDGRGITNLSAGAFTETDPRWASASNAIVADIAGRLASNVWTTAGSTTNYLARTGGTMSGALNMGAQNVSNVSHIDFAGSGVSLGRSADGSGAGAAMGYQANGSSGGATMGYQANSYPYGVAIGYQATSAWYGAAVGYSANGSDYGVAIGSSATGNLYGAVMGYLAIGTNYGVGVGYQANGSDSGVAVGYQANGYSSGAAVGYMVNGYSHGAAIGREANGYSSGAAVGESANGYSGGAAVGKSANGVTVGAAVGQSANGYSRGVAMGREANGSDYGVAAGYLAIGTNYGAAMGYQANGSSSGAVVGVSANGYYFGVAVGVSANGYGNGAAMGYQANGPGWGTAVGYEANGSDHGVAVGYLANGALWNVAIGAYADAKGGTEQIAIGHNVTNTVNNSTRIRGNLYLDGGLSIYTNGTFGSSGWGVKAFTIDHPLDPGNKILRHFCLEGPVVQNVYNGRVQLDAGGEAIVELPAYFEALNSDPQYVLTAVGTSMPGLYVKQEVKDNRFVIGGGVRGGKVCWEVKARRDDPGCLEDLRRRPVEQLKSEIR